MDLKVPRLIAEFASLYNAVANWQDSFSHLSADEIYTFEIKKSLLDTDGRPLLFLAFIEDIEKRGDTYLLQSNTEFGDCDSRHLRLVLEGDQGVVDKVLRRRRGGNLLSSAGLVVIARISSVSRPSFQVKAHSADVEDTDVTVESSDFFVVEGECVALMFLD